MHLGQALDFVEVDPPVLAPDTIGNRVKPFAGEVWPGSVRQVAARGKRHSEHGIAGLEQRQEHRLVRLGPGMRLDIGERAIEQPLGAVDRQSFGGIGEFAPAIIAATGVAFGILVG